VDVPVDQRLLVALEERPDLGHDLGRVDGDVDHVPSSAFATATSAASLPRAPSTDRPTGRPPTVAPGTLTWGTPVRPPCAVRQLIRARSGSSAARDSPFGGAGNGVVGRQRMVPAGSSQARRARASARINAAQWRSVSEIAPARASPRATLNCSRGL